MLGRLANCKQIDTEICFMPKLFVRIAKEPSISSTQMRIYLKTHLHVYIQYPGSNSVDIPILLNYHNWQLPTLACIQFPWFHLVRIDNFHLMYTKSFSSLFEFSATSANNLYSNASAPLCVQNATGISWHSNDAVWVDKIDCHGIIINHGLSYWILT